MKRFSLSFLISLLTLNLICQSTGSAREGTSAQQNINAIIKLAPYTDGAVGFDTRYEGVKGSPRLFDKLLPSMLKVEGQDYYIKLETDLDLEHNSLLFNHPKTGKLTSIPSDIVIELVVTNEGDSDLYYRTTNGLKFEKEMKETKFCQVLSETPVLFIKMPVKTLIEADYKGLYSADRPYDEYELKIRYYIATSDSILHQVQLNRNALLKLFPDKKDIIKNTIQSRSFKNDEEMVMAVLEKL